MRVPQRRALARRADRCRSRDTRTPGRARPAGTRATSWSWQRTSSTSRAQRTARGLDMLPFYRSRWAKRSEGGPKPLLIYQDNAARSGDYLLTSPLELPNSVYSFHLYPLNWPRASRCWQRISNTCRGWNQPVWLGEFGVFREKGRGQEPDPHWLPDLAAMMRYCREPAVGWAFINTRAAVGHSSTPTPDGSGWTGSAVSRADFEVVALPGDGPSAASCTSQAPTGALRRLPLYGIRCGLGGTRRRSHGRA